MVIVWKIKKTVHIDYVACNSFWQLITILYLQLIYPLLFRKSSMPFSSSFTIEFHIFSVTYLFLSHRSYLLCQLIQKVDNSSVLTLFYNWEIPLKNILFNCPICIVSIISFEYCVSLKILNLYFQHST